MGIATRSRHTAEESHQELEDPAARDGREKEEIMPFGYLPYGVS